MLLRRAPRGSRTSSSCRRSEGVRDAGEGPGWTRRRAVGRQSSSPESAAISASRSWSAVAVSKCSGGTPRNRPNTPLSVVLATNSTPMLYPRAQTPSGQGSEPFFPVVEERFCRARHQHCDRSSRRHESNNASRARMGSRPYVSATSIWMSVSRPFSVRPTFSRPVRAKSAPSMLRCRIGLAMIPAYLMYLPLFVEGPAARSQDSCANTSGISGITFFQIHVELGHDRASRLIPTQCGECPSQAARIHFRQDQICVSPSRLRDFPDGIPIKLPGPWPVPAVRGVILGKWLLEPEGE